MAAQGGNAPEPSEVDPDVLEQRQRLDGTYEVGERPPADVDRPLTPDEIEQLQDVDGEVTDPWAQVPTDGPVTPDVLDQQREVELPDDDEHPAD